MTVINSAVGEKAIVIVMKVKIGYSANGQKFSFEEKVANFPANLWSSRMIKLFNVLYWLLNIILIQFNLIWWGMKLNLNDSLYKIGSFI